MPPGDAPALRRPLDASRGGLGFLRRPPADTHDGQQRGQRDNADLDQKDDRLRVRQVRSAPTRTAVAVDTPEPTRQKAYQAPWPVGRRFEPSTTGSYTTDMPTLSTM